MTRAERLGFCNQCCHRSMDLKEGMLCGLTNEKATFDNVCKDFIQDEDKRPGVAHGQDRNIDYLELNEERLKDLKDQQNLPLAIMYGMLAGTVGALLWAIITVATGWQIGFMAVAVGYMVGHAVRFGGKGIDPIYGIIGASIAVISCLAGNFFSIIGAVAHYENLGYLETLFMVDWSQFMPIMVESFSVIDLLFYGFAGFEGWKFAFRLLTTHDLKANAGLLKD